jgi:hypothetical protein
VISERGHHLSIDMPQAPLPVLGDPAELAQAMASLLSNAA